MKFFNQNDGDLGYEITLDHTVWPLHFDDGLSVGASNFDDAERELRKAELKRLRILLRVAEVIQKVLRTGVKQFTVRRNAEGLARLSVVYQSNGQSLLNALDDWFALKLWEHLPTHASNPYLDLLKQALDADSSLQAYCRQWGILIGQTANDAIHRLNGLVSRIREFALSPEWRTNCESAQRKRRDNYRSLNEDFDKLFKNCGRPLLIRLDLSFRHRASASGARLSPVSIQRAKDDFQKFKRHVRAHEHFKFLKSRLEYGLLTGYHFHVVIALNGGKVCRDIFYGQQFGEYWANDATGGEGRYFNCNAVRYQYPAIGMVHGDDPAARDLVRRYVIGYLSKIDFWIEHEWNGKFMFTGWPRRLRGVGGRPRTVAAD